MAVTALSAVVATLSATVTALLSMATLLVAVAASSVVVTVPSAVVSAPSVERIALLAIPSASQGMNTIHYRSVLGKITMICQWMFLQIRRHWMIEAVPHQGHRNRLDAKLYWWVANHSRKRGFSSFVLTTSYCSDQECWITSNQCCCCSWKFVALFSPHHQRMEMSIYGQWW